MSVTDLGLSSGLQVFNNTPDETAFYRLTLEQEGVQPSLLMMQPTLTSFTFDGPPQPVLLDVASMRYCLALVQINNNYYTFQQEC